MGAYLDHSATTPPTEGVIGAMSRAMRAGYFNPSSLYASAIEAERAMFECRKAIAEAIHGEANGVILTSGGTEANNLAIFGTAERQRGSRHYITISTEHPSVLVPFEKLRDAGNRVTFLSVDRAGQPDWAQLGVALQDGAALVSCMQVNNETGAVIDLFRLTSLVRSLAPGAFIHVDGVQGFLRLPFDVRTVDLYTMSAHKIHGPKGVGALYARPGVRLAPRQLGGGQENGLRAGTENTPGIAGFLQAIREMRAIPDLEKNLREKKRLLHDLLIKAIPGARVNGPAANEGAPHILNMSFPPVGGEVMLHALEREGVYCSTGAACTSRKRRISATLEAMGVPLKDAECALRLSISPHTTEEEIRFAADALARNYEILKPYGRR